MHTRKEGRKKGRKKGRKEGRKEGTKKFHGNILPSNAKLRFSDFFLI